MVDTLSKMLSFLWEYYSDIFIWVITLLGIPSMFLWSWPAKLTVAERRAAATVFLILGLLAGFSSVHQKERASAENRLLIAGGGSIPRIIPMVEQGFLNLLVRNDGRFPHFDVRLQVTDHRFVRERKKHFDAIGKRFAREDFFFGPIQNLGVGTIGRNGATLLLHVKEVSEKEKVMDFTFDITTRNDTYQERLSLVRDGKVWKETNASNIFEETAKILALAGEHDQPSATAPVELGTTDNPRSRN